MFSAALGLIFLLTLARATSFERELLELVSKQHLTKVDKKRLDVMLHEPQLSDELLEKAFKPCIYNKLPSCKFIIAECGMRLTQEDVDRALVEKVKKRSLFAALLQGTNANPHRHGEELFSAYKESRNQYLLPFLSACPRFDPTANDNKWINTFAVHNGSQELILMLSDARVSASADMTSLMNSAINNECVWTATILAAHPRTDLDLIDQSHPGTTLRCMLHISDLLKVAKTPSGQFTGIQEEDLLQLLRGDWVGEASYLSIVYACLCSGNLPILHWMNMNMFGGNFNGGTFEMHYYGEFKLQMASTTACHGHLDTMEYLLSEEELEEDELNRILDVAHKANQFDIADWAATKLREHHPLVFRIYQTLHYCVGRGELIPEKLMEHIISKAQEFSLYHMKCPAITRQIIRDLEYRMAVAGCLSRGLPKELALMIAEAVRQHPMPITGHI